MPQPYDVAHFFVLSERAERRLVGAFVAFFAVLGVVIAMTTDGTGDNGDSIAHYLFAKTVFQHPENFFHPWAKPLFVLASAPFAQLGFVGIKGFNLLCASVTLWLTYRLAAALRIPNAWVAPVILATCTLYFTLIFSGLTEHLFALMLVWIVWRLHTEGFVSATLALSFLPFVRSEGLIIALLVAFFLILRGRWRYLPLLLVGHVAYGIAGAWAHDGNFWWTIGKISYLNPSPQYGSGSAWAFAEKLYYAAGLPNVILGILGVFFFLKNWRYWRAEAAFPTLFWLVGGSFVGIFAAHAFFWQFGLFGSFGLARVLNAVMPMFALIALVGFNGILSALNRTRWRIAAGTTLLAALILFHLTPNHAAIHWKTDFSLSEDERIYLKVADLVRTQYPDYRLYYMHQFICLPLSIDHFDTAKCRPLHTYKMDTLPQKSLLIWDSWFSVVEGKIQLEQLENDAQLEKIGHFSSDDRYWQFVVFKKR